MSLSHAIGFVCGGTSWGGLEMNVLRIARWLTEQDVCVYIFADKDSPLFGRAVGSQLRCHHFRSDFKYGDLVNARRLVALAERTKTRTLVLHTNKEMLVSVMARWLSRGKLRLVYQQHMHVGGSKLDPFHRWEYGQLDGWIAPLPMYAERVGRYTSVPKEKIHVIPFGIELDRFVDRQPSKEQARRTLNLPQDATIAGVVGRLDPKKGQDTALDAVAKLHREGLKVHLLLLGDRTRGEWEAFHRALEQTVGEHNLTAYVHFRPHTDEVAAAYAALDIFVLPSHSETYGMVTIEAMASGLPVIGTASGGTVEILDDGRTGLLVPPQDAQALAQALASLVNAPESVARLGQAARDEARGRFSHLDQCSRLIELFRTLDP